MNYRHQHFQQIGDADAARELFKASISAVNIEVSAFCNRKCSYCPSPLHQRYDMADVRMADDVFEKIIGELASIEYQGIVDFNLYNEPLHDRVYILRRLHAAHRSIPHALLSIHTNGDYLSPEYLDELAEAGVRRLIVSLHLKADEAFTEAGVMKRFSVFQRQIGHTFENINVDASREIWVETTLSGIQTLVRSANFNAIGNNRAGTLSAVAVGHDRQAPCDRPFSDFSISHEGLVVPCCNFILEADVSRENIAGDVRTSSIFEIYTAALLVDYRRDLFTFGSKRSPCDTCSDVEREAVPADVATRRRLFDEEFAALKGG
jgi:MoaA/NifB/PqqE/SkfB family radical SAM enzyme